MPALSPFELAERVGCLFHAAELEHGAILERMDAEDGAEDSLSHGKPTVATSEIGQTYERVRIFVDVERELTDDEQGLPDVHLALAALQTSSPGSLEGLATFDRMFLVAAGLVKGEHLLKLAHHLQADERRIGATVRLI